MYINNRERTYGSLAKAASIFFSLALVCLMVIGMKVLTSAETTESEPQQAAVAANEPQSAPAPQPTPTPEPAPTPAPREPEAAAGEAVSITGDAINSEPLSAQQDTPDNGHQQGEAGAAETEESPAEPPSGPEETESESGQTETAEDNEGEQSIDNNTEGGEEPETPTVDETPSDKEEGGDAQGPDDLGPDGPGPDDPGPEDPEPDGPKPDDLGPDEPDKPTEEAGEPGEDSEENEPADKEEEPEIEGDGEDATLDWEYPSGWIESGQKYVRGNIALAGIVKELETQLANEITHLKGVFDIPASARTKYSNDNLCEIIAVYAVLNGQTNDFPYGVKIQTTEEQHKFAAIFWDMVKLGYRESAGPDNPAYTIEVVRLSAEDIADQYELSEGQLETIKKLTGTSDRAKIDIIRNEGILTTISIEEYKRIQERVPAGSSGFRRAVLIAALSIEGKVRYFWGGKSYHVGWDQRWGQMRTVAADGSKTTGSARPMGLDCSGFVNWAFVNAYGNKDVRSLIGISSREQWARSYSVKWSEAKPGDLVFYHVPGTVNINHVGIILSAAKSGEYRIVHCSSSNNGVVVTGKKGFKYARRPYIYGE